MDDFVVSHVLGVAWSLPVAIGAILLPRRTALGLMNGIALIGILIAIGLRIAARIEGDISGYLMIVSATQWEVIAAAALILRLIRRRIA